MKRLLGAILVLALLPAAARGAPPTDRKLEPATVRLDDLPDGYASASETAETTTVAASDPAPDIGPTADLCGVPTPTALAQSSSAYSAGGMFGSYVFSVAGRYRSGDAKRYASGIAARIAAGSCARTSRTTDKGATETRTYVALKVPKLGDQSLGVRVRIKTEGGSSINLAPDVPIDLVLVRKGDVLTIVGSFAFFGQSTPVVPIAKAVALRLPKVR